MMNMISRLKWRMSLGLLLMCSCLFVSQSAGVDAQTSLPCYGLTHGAQLADCMQIADVSSMVETPPSDMLITHNEGVNSLWKLLVGGYKPIKEASDVQGLIRPAGQQSDIFLQQANFNWKNFPRFPPRSTTASALPFASIFKPFANINGANMSSSLAKITIPCTRDCSAICPLNPVCYANCQREALACWTLIDLYKGYMSGYIQQGVTYYDLSPQFKNALAPYIEAALGKTRSELDEITIGTSGNAGKNNAMTDCNKITWINSPNGNTIEQALRGANKNTNDILLSEEIVHWVYHEFVHTFQCDELGGRTEYAYNWWSELPPALLEANADPTQIHVHQPSEQNADSRGYDILGVMPVIIPRYVINIQPLGVKLSGATINFVGTARNILTSQTLGSVSFKDRPQFVVVDENDNEVVTLPAFPIPGESTSGTDPIYYIEGKFSASWTIPESLEGQTLHYKFEIWDNNNHLMDESDTQFLAIVKRYIYVDTNYTGGNEEGSQTRPYRTIQAALSDPDISKAVSIRVAGGTYTALTINTRVIIENDGSGVVTIR